MVARSKWLRHRGVLVITTLVALAIGSSAIVLWAVYRLPAPQHTTARELMRWLVTQDLREESADTRRALIVRLEQYLRDSNDLSSTTAELNDERRAMLSTNVDVLLPEWVAYGAERYERAGAIENPAFLDEQLRLVERVSHLCAIITQSPRDLENGNGIFQLVDAVEQIVVDAPPTQRELFGNFVLAMKMRWLATTDLADLDYDQLIELTARVEGELRCGTRLSNAESNVDPREGRQLWQNIDLIAEIWFRARVEEYSALSASRRPAYMTRLIDDVTQWPIIAEQLQPAPPAESGITNPLSLLMNNPVARAMKQLSQLEQQVNAWTLRAPAAVQPQMRDFISHARTALRIRFLKQFVTG